MSQTNFRVALALIGGLGMAGCDGQKEPEPGPSRDRTGAAFEEGLQGCAAAAEGLANNWIGKPYSEFEKMLQRSRWAHVADFRVTRPGDAVTKDYRMDRLNIMLDDKDVVTKLYCG